MDTSSTDEELGHGARYMTNDFGYTPFDANDGLTWQCPCDCGCEIEWYDRPSTKQSWVWRRNVNPREYHKERGPGSMCYSCYWKGCDQGDDGWCILL